MARRSSMAPVAFGRVLEREGEVEHRSRVDLPLPDQVDQVGQEPADRCRPAVQVHLGEEQLGAIQRDVMGDPDVADVSAGTGCPDRLCHRLLGTDRLDHRLRAEPVGELLDLGDPLVTALFDDVGRAEVACEGLPVGVPGHRDDAVGA